MTNNRLGISILDEIYLAYLMRSALLDDLGGAGAVDAAGAGATAVDDDRAGAGAVADAGVGAPR